MASNNSKYLQSRFSIPCCQELLSLDRLDSLYHARMEPEFDIAAWVREARLHWGQSQDALGDRLGKTKGNISAWENGRHEPSFKQVLQISAITGWPLPQNIKLSVSPDELSALDMVRPDDLIDLIRGYHKANAAERDAIFRIIRSALSRNKSASSQPA